jgi:hypothetical protein
VIEADYWLRLEYRVCRELAGMEDKALRWLWCDGFIPEQYWLDEATPQITGHAWIGTGPRGQERWKFTLLLQQTVRTREEISWSALLPPEDVTGWLGVDPDHRRIRITPSRAVEA